MQRIDLGVVSDFRDGERRVVEGRRKGYVRGMDGGYRDGSVVLRDR